MKRLFGCILMLLIANGGAQATALCARMLCPMQTMKCCCDAEMNQTAQPKMHQPLSCELPVSTQPPLKIRSTAPGCCTYSPTPEPPVRQSPLRRAAQLLELKSGEPCLTWALMLPPLSADVSFPPTDAGGVSLDRSDTYLRIATFRI